MRAKTILSPKSAEDTNKIFSPKSAEDNFIKLKKYTKLQYDYLK